MIDIIGYYSRNSVSYISNIRVKEVLGLQGDNDG